MKILIVVMLLISQFSIGQITKGEIKYSKSIRYSDAYKGRVNAKSIKSSSESINYTLVFNNKEALFKVDDKMVSDNSTMADRMAIIKGEGKGIYYTNFGQGYTIRQNEFGGQQFLIKMKHLNFILTEKTKKIGNFSCREAKYSLKEKAPGEGMKSYQIDITVWYSPEIPFSIGPLHFFNLPGAVLEATLGNVTYTATNISIDPEMELIIEEPKKGKLISEDNLLYELHSMRKKI
mgnify:CR=1 FL=1|tara:strand:+ start:874 stop:1575 length:702 start_codon:yes stop_codon:yes gene_type:complete